MLKIGIRAHDMGGKYSLEEANKISSLVEKLGGTSVQLALNKSFYGMENLSGKLTPGLGKTILKEFSKNNVEISVLGSYINLGNPDHKLWRKEIEKFKEHIRFSKFIGHAIVGTETGCYNSEYKYTELNETEEAFERFLQSLKELVETAEQLGVVIAIEGVERHIINTPEKMKKALDLVKSENLVVIFDPVNFLSVENYHLQDKIVEDSFRMFGDRIAIIHAKDYLIENGEMKVVPATYGQFNYPLLLKYLKEQKPGIDILLENSTVETVETIIGNMKDIYMGL